MNANQKLAQHRLSVLELAQALGSVSEACKRKGMTRTMFYEYKKRFVEQGIEGLKDLPPIAKSHPFTTAPEVVERIKQLALEHPAWGCNRLEALLMAEGRRVSSITIQEILNRNALGNRYDRWLALEQQRAQEGLELSAEQTALLEKLNPQYKERHVESSTPGELLSQDIYLVGSIKGVGKVYLHSVVDTFGSYGFGFLHTSKQPEAAVAVLHNDVLPFYAQKKLSVKTILTDNGREYCGTEMHPFQMYLALNEIEHRTTKIRSPQTNGFVERFHRTVQEEFVQTMFRQKVYLTVEDLQSDLDEWLVFYNTQRPHLGYRNMGRRPIETVEQFCTQQTNIKSKIVKQES
ncbi:IS481 family transposase [Larkinella sp. VNQ87]|uniref:IS481 family transposase n=1 Tax=Larkinella sp. VNQ87 TaxID=3400921 RepID=UPI003BFE5AC8